MPRPWGQNMLRLQGENMQSDRVAQILGDILCSTLTLTALQRLEMKQASEENATATTTASHACHLLRCHVRTALNRIITTQSGRGSANSLDIVIIQCGTGGKYPVRFCQQCSPPRIWYDGVELGFAVLAHTV